MRRFKVSRVLYAAAAVMYVCALNIPRMYGTHIQSAQVVGALVITSLLVIAGFVIGRSKEASKIRKLHYVPFALPVCLGLTPIPLAALVGINQVWTVMALNVAIIAAYTICITWDVRDYRNKDAEAESSVSP